MRAIDFPLLPAEQAGSAASDGHLPSPPRLLVGATGDGSVGADPPRRRRGRVEWPRPLPPGTSRSWSASVRTSPTSTVASREAVRRASTRCATSSSPSSSSTRSVSSFPLLAESWERVDDSTWRFTLRQGVTLPQRRTMEQRKLPSSASTRRSTRSSKRGTASPPAACSPGRKWSTSTPSTSRHTSPDRLPSERAHGRRHGSAPATSARISRTRTLLRSGPGRSRSSATPRGQTSSSPATTTNWGQVPS